jgi:aldehyde:ferredoxin oxidoreductase
MVRKLGGYTGKLLKVDLSKEKISFEEKDETFYRRYLGGWTLIAYTLLKELKPGVEALNPENLLIFAPGVLTGAPFAGNGRNAVGGKSPLTEGFASTEVGGFWGAELKHAGFDGIVVKGKAKAPVYLWVHDGEVEIRDASHLWGMDTGDSLEKIQEELGDKLVRAAQIGKGGENLVRFACVMNGLKDAAGRTGMGALMGSKNLKAVAVRGKMKTAVEDSKKLSELNAWYRKEGMLLTERLSKYGTGRDLTGGVESGNLPTRNFRDGEFEKAWEISAEPMLEEYGIGMEGCFACPIRCKKVVKIEKEGLTVNPAYGGPEYETLAALGSNCGVGEVEYVALGSELCNRYSLDTIAAGMVVAFAMECYEHGILTKEDTGGLDLTWGNGESMVKLVEMIGDREGIGDLLAEGTMRASNKLGKESEKYVVTVKGQEFPMHEPRLKRALGIGYAVSATGADHVHNIHDTFAADRIEPFMSLGILDPLVLEDLGPDKIRYLIAHKTWRTLLNSSVVCSMPAWSYEQMAEITKAVTGWNSTVYELMKVGERGINLSRIFNLREGKTSKDDWLPDRMFHPQTSGALSETPVDPDQLRNAIQSYYGMMGWDRATGVPSRGKLDELGIAWAADHL